MHTEKERFSPTPTGKGRDQPTARSWYQDREGVTRGKRTRGKKRVGQNLGGKKSHHFAPGKKFHGREMQEEEKEGGEPVSLQGKERGEKKEGSPTTQFLSGKNCTPSRPFWGWGGGGPEENCQPVKKKHLCNLEKSGPLRRLKRERALKFEEKGRKKTYGGQGREKREKKPAAKRASFLVPLPKSLISNQSRENNWTRGGE